MDVKRRVEGAQKELGGNNSIKGFEEGFLSVSNNL
jgi:hypothetical protein